MEHIYVHKFRHRTTAAVFTPTNILNSARAEVSYNLRHSSCNETIAHREPSDVTETFVKSYSIQFLDPLVDKFGGYVSVTN